MSVGGAQHALIPFSPDESVRGRSVCATWPRQVRTFWGRKRRKKAKRDKRSTTVRGRNRREEMQEDSGDTAVSGKMTVWFLWCWWMMTMMMMMMIEWRWGWCWEETSGGSGGRPNSERNADNISRRGNGSVTDTLSRNRKSNTWPARDNYFWPYIGAVYIGGIWTNPLRSFHEDILHDKRKWWIGFGG